MKKLLMAWAGLMLVAALVAFGCGNPSPSETINDAMTKSQDVKSEHVDFDVNLKVSGDASALGAELAGILPLDLNFSGGADIDNNDPESPKAQGNLKLEGINDLLSSLAGASGESDAETQMGLNLIGGMISEIDFVLVDQTAYAKLAGSWYNLGDASEITDVAGMSGINLDTSGGDTKCLEDAMKDPSKFGADQVFSNISEESGEQIDGTDTRHFTADVDIDKTVNSLAAISRDCGNAEAAGGLEGGAGEITGLFRTLSVDMWIDKDNNLRQVKVTVDVDPQAVSDLAGSFTGDSGDSFSLDELLLTATVKFSQFGASFDISKPSGTIMDINDVLGGTSLGSDLGIDMSGLEGLEGTGGTSTTGGSSTSTTSSYSR
jgi:hypothetical protein